MSSFSGKIKEFPQISVDRFDGRNLASTAYFLSHAHSDHMVGLSSPQFLDHLESNNGVYLYCSAITARFLQASIRHRPLDPYVRPLHLEEPVKITVPNVAEEASHQLCVTLIPAGHCPGSVMFLFEGRGGTVLYTGDFRTSVGDVERIRALHNADGTVKTVDSLHIDTTFCHRDILHFPTREESCSAIGDLVEDWLARGNNYLLHLVCPAKYGYEYVYRSLHERFGMRVHVSRWKYRMYDTVPEIQDALTPDATETWIHACDWRTNEVEDGEDQTVRQLPCRCVPFGVDTAPSIRVIRPSVMFYTHYQSAKEVKQVNRDGTFCRVLLSMHASCLEVLDLVSYLRPRKVYPNVIPTNSSREEVLKLLHEALNRSGDHYSIEYGGTQRRSMGSFKRQLQSNESNSSTLEAAMLDGFLTSPSKRRRHSDSNMTLVLPTPRGNMKGSLSLEGEARCEAVEGGGPPPPLPPPNCGAGTSGNEVPQGSPRSKLEWVDPYTPSPVSSSCKYGNTPDSSQEDYQHEKMTNFAKVDLMNKFEATSSVETVSDSGVCNVIVKVMHPSGKVTASGGTGVRTSGGETYRCGFNSQQMSVDAEEEGDNQSLCSFNKTHGSQDSIDLASVFSDDTRESTVMVEERPASSAGVAGESPIKRSRKMWYKHKYFSTPVHDEGDKRMKVEPKPIFGPRSSSLPLPEPDREGIVSPDLFPSPEADRSLPLITVSSPSDQASESQVSDETNVTVVLSGSSGEPSDLDVMLVDELPPDLPLSSDSNQHANQAATRPSVICGPLLPTSPQERDSPLGTDSRMHLSISSSSDSSGIDSAGSSSCVPPPLKSPVATSTPNVVDLVSDSDCTPDLDDLIIRTHQVTGMTVKTQDYTTERSTCLKTTRRRDNEVEVVTLEQQHLCK
ncbi:Protein artemis [Halocaridina rubra]|uniref:Protein artemis n=1 Tax=Halocaridina rubra TaxID=373956 RepID=A0AAN8WS67_HALRR